MTSISTRGHGVRLHPTDTKPLIPAHVQYHLAEQRIAAAYGRAEGAAAAIALFRQSVEDLRRVGLTGTGLIVAAEHMAGARLHQSSQAIVKHQANPKGTDA